MVLTLEQRRLIDEVMDEHPKEFLLRFSRYILRNYLVQYGEDDELVLEVQHLIENMETEDLTHNELVQIARSINSSYPAPLRLEYLHVPNTDRISHRLLRVLHYEMPHLLEIVNEIRNERVVRGLLLREARHSREVPNRLTSLLRLGIHGMEDIRHRLEHEDNVAAQAASHGHAAHAAQAAHAAHAAQAAHEEANRARIARLSIEEQKADKEGTRKSNKRSNRLNKRKFYPKSKKTCKKRKMKWNVNTKKCNLKK